MASKEPQRANGRMRFVIKLIAKALRHPLHMLKNLEPRKIRALVKKLRSGDVSRAEELVNYSLAVSTPLSERLALINAKETRHDTLAIPQCGNPTVSVVIYARGEWEYTRACVQAVVQHSGDPAYEIIIADDASEDKTKELERYIKGALHVRSGERLGRRESLSIAAQSAKGRYIVFLDSRVQPQPGWLAPLTELLDGDESIGLAGVKLISPKGKLYQAGGIIFSDASVMDYGRSDDPSKPDYNYLKDADYVSGAAVIVRTSLWNELGGFDVSFASGCYADADFAFSARELGYRAVYAPLSAAVYFEGQKQSADGKAMFFDKWKDTLQAQHFPPGEGVFLARDRTRGKKTVLFIDQFVPMYDKDAGSRNTYLYVKLCLEMGCRVLFLSDSFFPHQPYTGELEQMGVMVLHGVWYRDYWKRWLKQTGAYIDVVYMNRPIVSLAYIDFVRAYTRAKIVYHGVDLHCARIMAQYEAQGSPALLKEAEEWEKRERALFAKADLILTVSEKEKPVIEAMSAQKPVMVLPIFYFDAFPRVPSFSARRGVLFVGGFAHPPNADAVLWFCSEILPLLPPDTRLTVVGSKPPPEIEALASERVEIAGFVSEEELARLYGSCRIAVAPLRFGAGVKGKTVEAVYNLIPFVSTSFGIEGLPEAETIIPPKDDAAGFAEELNRFLSSDEACQSAAEAYRLWIEKWFSKEHAREVVRAIIE